MDETHLRFMRRYLQRDRSKPILKICISENDTSDAYIEDDESSLDGSVLYVVDSFSDPRGSFSCHEFVQTRDTYSPQDAVRNKITRIRKEAEISSNLSNTHSSKPAITQTATQCCSKHTEKVVLPPGSIPPKAGSTSPAEELIGQFNPDYPELQRNQELISQENYEATRLLEKSTSHTFNACIPGLKPVKSKESKTTNNDKINSESCQCDCDCDEPDQSQTKSDIHATPEKYITDTCSENVEALTNNKTPSFHQNTYDTEYKKCCDDKHAPATAQEMTPCSVQESCSPKCDTVSSSDICDLKASSSTCTDKCSENVEAPTKKKSQKKKATTFFGKQKSDTKRKKKDSKSKLLIDCECYEPESNTNFTDKCPENAEQKRKAPKKLKAPLSGKGSADTCPASGEVPTKKVAHKKTKALAEKDQCNTYTNNIDSRSSKLLTNYDCKETDPSAGCADICPGSVEEPTKKIVQEETKTPLSGNDQNNTYKSKRDLRSSKSLTACDCDEPETNTECVDTCPGSVEEPTKKMAQQEIKAPLSGKDQCNTYGSKLDSRSSKSLTECDCDETVTNTGCADNGEVSNKRKTPRCDDRTPAAGGNKPDLSSTNVLTTEPCCCKLNETKSYTRVKSDTGITGACPEGACQQNPENIGEPRRNRLSFLTFDKPCNNHHSETNNEQQCDCGVSGRLETTPSSRKKLDTEIKSTCPEGACRQNSFSSEMTNLLTRGSDSFYKLIRTCKQCSRIIDIPIRKKAQTKKLKLKTQSSKPSVTDCECDKPETNTECVDTCQANEVPTKKKAQKKKTAPLYKEEKRNTHRSKLDSRSSKSLTDCDCDEPETRTGCADRCSENGEVPTKNRAQKKTKAPLSGKYESNARGKLESKSSKSLTDCDCDEPDTNTGCADTCLGSGKVTTRKNAQQNKNTSLSEKEQCNTQRINFDSRSSRSLNDCDCDEPESNTECADTCPENGEEPTQKMAQKKDKTPLSRKKKSDVKCNKTDSVSTKSLTECECDEPETKSGCEDTCCRNGEVPTKKRAHKKTKAPLSGKDKSNARGKLDSRSSNSLTDCDCDEPDTNTGYADTFPGSGEITTKKKVQKKNKTPLSEKDQCNKHRNNFDSRSSKSRSDCDCDEPDSNTECADTCPGSGEVPTKKRAKTPLSEKDQCNTHKTNFDSRSSKSRSNCDCDEPETNTGCADTCLGSGEVPTRKNAREKKKTHLPRKKKSDLKCNKTDSESNKSLTECECDKSETNATRITHTCSNNLEARTKKGSGKKKTASLSGKDQCKTHRKKLDSRSSKSRSDCECDEPDSNIECADTCPGSGEVPTKKRAHKKCNKTDSVSSKSLTECECDESETNATRIPHTCSKNLEGRTKKGSEKKKTTPFCGKKRSDAKHIETDSGSIKSLVRVCNCVDDSVRIEPEKTACCKPDSDTNKLFSETGSYYKLTETKQKVSDTESLCSRESMQPKDGTDILIKISVNQKKDSDSRIGTCQKKPSLMHVVSKVFNKLCKKANGHPIQEESDSLKENCSCLGDKLISDRESANGCECIIPKISQISEKQTKNRKPYGSIQTQTAGQPALSPPCCPCGIVEPKPTPTQTSCFCTPKTGKQEFDGIKLHRIGTDPNMSKAYASQPRETKGGQTYGPLGSAESDEFTTIKPYQLSHSITPDRMECGTRYSRSDVVKRNTSRPMGMTSEQSGLSIKVRGRLSAPSTPPAPTQKYTKRLTPSGTSRKSKSSQCCCNIQVTQIDRHDAESSTCYDRDDVGPCCTRNKRTGPNGRTRSGYVTDSRGYLVPLNAYSTKHRTQTRDTGAGSDQCVCESQLKPQPYLYHDTKCVSSVLSDKSKECACNKSKEEEVPTPEKPFCPYFSFLRIKKYLKDKKSKKKDNKTKTQSTLVGHEPITTPRRSNNIVPCPHNGNDKQVIIYWEKPTTKDIQGNDSQIKPCCKKPCCTRNNNRKSLEKPSYSNTYMQSKAKQSFHCNMNLCPTELQHVNKKKSKEKFHSHHNNIQGNVSPTTRNNSQMSHCNLHCPVKDMQTKKINLCCRNDIQADNSQISCCSLHCPDKDIHSKKSKDKIRCCHNDIQASNSQMSCCSWHCPVKDIHSNKSKERYHCCHKDIQANINHISSYDLYCLTEDNSLNNANTNRNPVEFRCCHEIPANNCETSCCNLKCPSRDMKAKTNRKSREKFHCCVNDIQAKNQPIKSCCKLKNPSKANKSSKPKEKFHCCNKHSFDRKIKSCCNLHCPVKDKHAKISQSNQELCTYCSGNLTPVESSSSLGGSDYSQEVQDSGLSFQVNTKLSRPQNRQELQPGQSGQTCTFQGCPVCGSQLPSCISLTDICQRMQELSAEASRACLDIAVERNLREVSHKLEELSKRLPKYSKQDENKPKLLRNTIQTKKLKTICYCRTLKKHPKRNKVKTSSKYKGDSSGVISIGEYEMNKKKKKKTVTVSTDGVVVKPTRKRMRAVSKCECSDEQTEEQKFNGIKLEMKGKGAAAPSVPPCCQSILKLK